MINSYFLNIVIFLVLLGFMMAFFLYLVEMLFLLPLKDFDLKQGEVNYRSFMFRFILIGILFLGGLVSGCSFSSVVEKLMSSGNFLMLSGALIPCFFLS